MSKLTKRVNCYGQTYGPNLIIEKASLLKMYNLRKYVFFRLILFVGNIPKGLIYYFLNYSLYLPY